MEVRTRPIFVVEDEQSILELLCDTLQLEGYRVVGFAYPPSPQTLESQEEPELILVDLMLPGINGIELARRLRADGFPSTPMVAMSASNGMLKAASEAHIFEDTLPKPFDLSTLLDTVERYAA